LSRRDRFLLIRFEHAPAVDVSAPARAKQLAPKLTSGEAFVLLNLGPVSVRVRPGGAAEFTHLDHLGSPVAATAANGALLWRESYNPFGEKRIDPSANRDRPGFTGHIDDDATGLTYMQARYYDPVLGRFLANDPVGFTPDRPDMFNSMPTSQSCQQYPEEAFGTAHST
jgi:RHS repeat-associated protein